MVRRMLKDTPPLRTGSEKMFRELGQEGIISYAEYLFILTLLTSRSHAIITNHPSRELQE